MSELAALTMRGGRSDGSYVQGFSDEAAAHGAWAYDLGTHVIDWTEGVHRMHGTTPGEFRPTLESVRELVHPEDLEMYRRVFQNAVRDRAPFVVQHRIRRPDDEVRTLLVHGEFMAGDGESGRVVGITQDVTDRDRDEDRLWHLANHDPLTSLYNRRRFMEELKREVATAQRSGSTGAVLMLDVDRFKEVNDTLGHQTGDHLLARVGERLRGRLRTTDTLARLGGDEFAVVLPGCTLQDAEHVAVELRDAVRARPGVRIAGRERRLAVSVGIARFGAGSDAGPTELLVEADLAMYRAKAQGGDCIEVFDENMRAELAARLRIEAELREALERDELEVFYQPIASIVDGSVIGCESLVRWRHPERGLVSPAEFIPIAEERGLISEIGELVLERACRQAREWRLHGRNLFVTVNVSPLQLARDDVAATVRRILNETELPAPLLHVEVTETSMLDEAGSLAPALHALREIGVRVAIDDFGGGSSSLSRLRVLPIDEIKVDRIFIEGLPVRPDDRAIVAAVLSLADELGLMVIAEGVETERQHWELRELGCRYAQGFLYARPAPPEDLDLDGYSAVVQPGVGDPSVIREFMRQIGIPAARMGVAG
jgi:diguanylate cyclase (GGDEF)-like protein/PAS domain S-box-containing protein